MADSRLSLVSAFTPTLHHNVPEALTPEINRLPPGQTICIVGAGRGIGEHIAYAYARAGVHSMVIASRCDSDLSKVAENVRSISDQISIERVVCDVASASSVAALADIVKTRFGRLDILIMNAGYAGPVTLEMHKGQPEWVQQAFDINTMGTYHAAHFFVPLLLGSKDGAKTFISIGSLAALIRRGHIANTGYCVSKLAQARLVEMLSEQYSDQGLVTINTHPGAVMTTMSEGNTPESFVPYLIDDIALCGAVCVWLSAHIKELQWLSGRLISANWDMDEMFARKAEIVERDLLKMAMAI